MCYTPTWPDYDACGTHTCQPPTRGRHANLSKFGCEVGLLRGRGWGYGSVFTTRAASIAMMTSEMLACSMHRNFAGRDRTTVSVGLNAVLVLNATNLC